MKITNISCEQFAGVRDRSVAFTDGINVIYGKNESGKSTLVNLISRTLFQSTKVDRRKNKDFYEDYFPAAKKGSPFLADSADGKIAFETEKGAYTLTKEWGSDARCVLSTPDGVLRDASAIAAELREALAYGEGVYANMLLSSQRNTDNALQTILDVSKKNDAKQEIVDAVSQAFAESDGISTDAIEQAIQKKIDEIAGKHWDADREVPVRKVGRWTNGLGEILKAYYALEDAKNVLKEISDLEREADNASSEYIEKHADFQKAEEAFHTFNGYASKLTLVSERKKMISRIENDLEKFNDILTEWPKLVENVKKAKTLENELIERKSLDLYASAKSLHDELVELKADADNMLCPQSSEVSEIKSAQRKVTTLENKLCGMNLTAAIKMLGGHQMEIKSLRTGTVINATEAASITEAVSITIPGVVEMQLAPANVDVEDIERSLSEQRLIIQNIFKKYSVSTLDELETLSRNYSELQNKIAEKKAKLSAALGSISFEDAEKAATSVTGAPRSKEEISADIFTLCGGKDISRCIVSDETTIKRYESDYISIAELKAKAFDSQAELSKVKDSISDVEEIPAEFAGITDPEKHLNKLQEKLKSCQKDSEEAMRKKTVAATSLEQYKESISDDPIADVEKAEREFAEQKALLAHWKHIEKVFKQQKENITENPLVDLAENFTRYLGIISGGKVDSEFPDADKLTMNIYSSDRLIDYSKLSEGTKETVSLAFRLAVLNHLFPNGGGIAVFDDPFANMDAERTEQSVELIKDFANRHQVIFLTCKEEYLDILGGNRILL